MELELQERIRRIKAAILEGKHSTLANMAIALFQRQVEDERASNHTGHNNSRGFNKPDARGCSLAAKWAIKHRFDQPFEMPDWMVERLQAKLPKYAKQLAEIATDPYYKATIQK